jgi:hypothetical protein
LELQKQAGMYVFRSLLSFALGEMFSEAKKRKETLKEEGKEILLY